MTEAERIQRAFLRAVAEAKRQSPYRTGNLRIFGMSSRVASARELDIYVNEQKAPYMKYTNEPWSNFKPPLRGKQNPNEGWWGRAARSAAQCLARELGGTLQ
jgi:hypothetical protein